MVMHLAGSRHYTARTARPIRWSGGRWPFLVSAFAFCTFRTHASSLYLLPCLTCMHVCAGMIRCRFELDLITTTVLVKSFALYLRDLPTHPRNNACYFFPIKSRSRQRPPIADTRTPIANRRSPIAEHRSSIAHRRSASPDSCMAVADEAECRYPMPVCLLYRQPASK